MCEACCCVCYCRWEGRQTGHCCCVMVSIDGEGEDGEKRMAFCELLPAIYEAWFFAGCEERAVRSASAAEPEKGEVLNYCNKLDGRVVELVL
jgi:hypothetical protein